MIPVQPLLPLDIWRQCLGFDAWRFWGWTDNGYIKTTTACNPVITEYDWQQTDAAGRFDVAEAIIEAENKLQLYLEYEVAPKFKTAELQYPQLLDTRMIRNGPYNNNGQWNSIALPEGYIQALGSETLTLLQANVVITYTSSGTPDGYPDIATVATITLSTPITDISQVVLYVSAADRIGLETDVGDQWQITPIVAKIVGDQLTIKFGGYMGMKPVLKEGYGNSPPDPSIPANFIATVDVYQKYCNPNGITVDQSQGVVYWESSPNHCGWCQCGCTSNISQGSPFDPSAISQAAARVGIRNARLGDVTPVEALYDTTTSQWIGQGGFVAGNPDRVLVRYLAGFPLERGRIARKWWNIVARMGAAELNRPLVGCAEENRALFHWQQDLAKIGNDKELYQVSSKTSDNRFGTRRGHIDAWNSVMDLRMTRGTLVL